MITYTIPVGQTTVHASNPSGNFPLTVTLNSSDGSRKIEFSTNNGVEYFQPTIDVTSATMLVVSSLTPISDIKVTGAAGDTLVILGGSS